MYETKFHLPIAVRNVLPVDAQEVFRVAANESAAAGAEYNEVMRAGWAKVGEGWERPKPGFGKKWVRKRTRPPRERRLPKTAAGEPAGTPDPTSPAQAAHDAAVQLGAVCEHSMPQIAHAEATACKVNDELGLVFGWAICCTIDGQAYFDTQGDHIPEDAMLKAATDFMLHSRVACDMHEREPGSDIPVENGTVVFCFPVTSDIAKAMGWITRQTGLAIAMKPDDPEILQKYRTGEYTGFSMGGDRVNDEEV